MKIEELFEATDWQKEQVKKMKDISVDASLDFLSYVNPDGYNLPSTMKSLIKKIDEIKKDCVPFIKEMKSWPSPAMLYRGLTTPKDYNNLISMVEKSTKKDRKPKDSIIEIQNIFDTATQELFGIKFRSANILFATGSAMDADKYGKGAYYVFPIGNFKFLWSPSVDDLYVSSLYFQILKTIEKNEYTTEKLVQYVKMLISKKYKYSNENLFKALSSGNEIMVQAEKYHAINSYEFSIFIKGIKKNEPEMKKELEGKNSAQILYYAITGEQQ